MRKRPCPPRRSVRVEARRTGSRRPWSSRGPLARWIRWLGGCLEPAAFLQHGFWRAAAPRRRLRYSLPPTTTTTHRGRSDSARSVDGIILELGVVAAPIIRLWGRASTAQTRGAIVTVWSWHLSGAPRRRWHRSGRHREQLVIDSDAAHVLRETRPLARSVRDATSGLPLDHYERRRPAWSRQRLLRLYVVGDWATPFRSSVSHGHSVGAVVVGQYVGIDARAFSLCRSDRIPPATTGQHRSSP